MPTKTNRGLGRGLDALPRTGSDDPAAPELASIAVSRIFANRYQPRRFFDEESLKELASSILSNGILEPLLLRPIPDGYELVAGERRLRAAKMAGLGEVPAIVRFFDDRQAAEIALIENLQREDLSPLEEATALKRLSQEYNLTQEETALRIGRSRSYVANSLRLLQLTPQVQEQLSQGLLEMGHARCLISLPPDVQLAIAAEIIAKKLSVRQVESRVKALDSKEPTKKSPPTSSSIPSKKLVFWEGKLKSHLQTVVKIQGSKKKGTSGEIAITYFDDEDLERILSLLLAEDQLEM